MVSINDTLLASLICSSAKKFNIIAEFVQRVYLWKFGNVEQRFTPHRWTVHMRTANVKIGHVGKNYRVIDTHTFCVI